MPEVPGVGGKETSCVHEMKYNTGVPQLPPAVGKKKHSRKECVFPKWKGLKVQVQVRILEQGAVPMSPSTISSFSTFYKWRNQDTARLYDTAQFVLEQG